MKKLSISYFLLELVIVIVGVTIAFWLNTRAEESKEQKVLEGYYLELLTDLSQDRNQLNALMIQNELKRDKMLQAIGLYNSGQANRDSVFTYSQLIGNYSFLIPKDITYQSMINSGDLKLIKAFDVKRKLISLYSRYATIDHLQKNHLQALDANYFPKYVYMVDYISGEVVEPIESDIMIKNYFAFSANELSLHLQYYRSALQMNIELDSLIQLDLNK